MSGESFASGVASGELDFDTVWKEYHGRVHRWVRRLVASRQDAEELTSDVFERVWSRRAGFVPSRSSLCHWIYLNAKTVVIGYLRSREEPDLRLDLIPEECGPTIEGPEERHAAVVRDERVRTAVGELPGPEAAVMQSHYLDGLSWPAVGRSLGMSRRNAQYRGRRGLELLRTKLAPGQAGWVSCAVSARPADSSVKMGTSAH